MSTMVDLVRGLFQAINDYPWTAMLLSIYILVALTVIFQRKG